MINLILVSFLFVLNQNNIYFFVHKAGLILAGSADFKTELSQSDMFDPVSIFKIILICPTVIKVPPSRDFNQK